MPILEAGHSFNRQLAADREPKSIRFEDTVIPSPPTSAGSHDRESRPPSSSHKLSPGKRNKTASDHSIRSSIFKRRSHLSDDARRDSGMATSVSTVGSGSAPAVGDRTPEPLNAHDVPTLQLNDEEFADAREKSSHDDQRVEPVQGVNSDTAHGIEHREDIEQRPAQSENFETLTTEIPTGDIDDPFGSNELTFSKRGSVLWSGKKLSRLADSDGCRHASKGSMGSTRPPSRITLSPDISRSQSRMSLDERRISQRIRFMYDAGDEHLETWSEDPTSEPVDKDTVPANASGDDSVGDLPRIVSPRLGNADDSRSRSPSSRRSSYIKKEPWEAAGGIEDWRDIQQGDVDRYGFIKMPPRPSTQQASGQSTTRNSESRPHSSSHQHSGNENSSPEALRRPRKLQRHGGNSAHRLSAMNGMQNARPASRIYGAREVAPSVTSNRSKFSVRSAFPRSGDPYKGRRWARDALTMLTSEPGRPETGTPGASEPLSPSTSARQLERRREAKWETMARHPQKPRTSKTKQSTKPVVGGGASYTFDTTDPKLISRVWKGIPNKWRGAAWHAFLTTSAQKQQGAAFVPDAALEQRYHVLQQLDCPDDAQIDVDVPRTIGGHIMFRARYRGGQRLMFRVLRALSLQFPRTGYVQGMAALAATLLTFADEERAFVMAVRLWEARGMRRLFSPGFKGLLAVLDGFWKGWLEAGKGKKGGVVAAKLAEMGIAPDAFGTKWYLTLFSYSVPVEAQLRIWDVFMLLGDPSAAAMQDVRRKWEEKASLREDDGVAVGAVERGDAGDEHDEDEDDANIPPGQYDALHAVAAALLDALLPVLVEGEFESVMRALTSHVPVGRADVLMRVARREWGERKG